MPSRVLAVLSWCASVRPRLPAGTVYIYIDGVGERVLQNEDPGDAD